jgi:hypothetical protein
VTWNPKTCWWPGPQLAGWGAKLIRHIPTATGHLSILLTETETF